MIYPSYLESYKNGRLDTIIEETSRILSSCCLCPRKCGVDRLKGEKGYCRTGSKAVVCSFMPHHGEEPPISGSQGSGAIFFSHCNMSCAYCQNYEFSQLGEGREVSDEELAEFMLHLQQSGCHNINVVTPTHVMPQILVALRRAIEKGLKIPLVYNTGGYELPEIVRFLDGIVDIYLPDMRYADNDAARKYSNAPDYPRFNQRGVKEMHRQVGIAQLDEYGIIKRGVIIRHLVLPNEISGTEAIMKFVSEELSQDTYISLMSQYSPYYQAANLPEIARRLNPAEYEKAKKIMHSHGLYNGWTQGAGGVERFAGVHIKRGV